jgi:hypothetical protein
VPFLTPQVFCTMTAALAVYMILLQGRDEPRARLPTRLFFQSNPIQSSPVQSNESCQSVSHHRHQVPEHRHRGWKGGVTGWMSVRLRATAPPAFRIIISRNNDFLARLTCMLLSAAHGRS